MTAPGFVSSLCPPPLWAHQQQAVAFVSDLWERERRGAMCAVIMGGGKSRIAIELANQYQLSPLLILSPLRVVDVWREQFARHAPDQYEFLALNGDAGQVAERMRAARDRLEWCRAKSRRCAIAINYESARQEPFRKWALANFWRLTIADESHKNKEPSGLTSRFVGQLGLRSFYRLALTGTPMPHSPLDIWAQFRFVDRHVYDPTFISFRLRYAIMGGFHQHEVKGWRDLDELRQKFFSRAFQVGPEVLDLPGEQDLTLTTDLTAGGARIYRDMDRQLCAWLESGVPVTAANALVRLLRLQQIAAGSVKDAAGVEHCVDSAKGRLLEDLLEDLAADEPVVVFCLFRADLRLVRAIADSLGRPSAEVSGDAGEHELAAWKRGRKSDPVILAVQIAAGGVGIDLTRARYAVYFSTGFNLGAYLQSRARLYRAGQTRPVMFYHLVVRSTVDEMVARALAKRQGLIDNVLKEDLVDSVLKELRCPHPLPTI